MKYPLIGMLCLSILVVSGCQSYPKHPVYPSLSKRVLINHAVPTELQPYELPPKVQYMDGNQTVPKTIIVTVPVAPVVQTDSVETPVISEASDTTSPADIASPTLPVAPIAMPLSAVAPVTLPLIEDNARVK